MKNYLLLILLVMSVIKGTSQSDEEQFQNYTQLKTPELIGLYEQGRALESANASAEAIEANRLAIKDAWMQVNPEIGNLYKPIDTEGVYPDLPEYLHLNGAYVPDVIKQRDETEHTQNRWANDVLIYNGFVDGGVNVVVDNAGVIYTSHFQNNIDHGGSHDIIFIHQSTDEGDTWTEFAAVNIVNPVRQLQLVSIHGSGDNYLLAYFLTESNTFQVLRWNTPGGGAYSAQVVAPDVTEFAVDRNYPISTSGQRVFAIYKKTGGSNLIRSARSTAGSFGFDWVDESAGLFNGESVDIAYGISGSCYIVVTGSNTNNLRFNANPNFNDPATWGAFETIEFGADRETLNPTIVAGRVAIANDNVLIFASSRVAGSTGNFHGRSYRRTNSGAFPPGVHFAAGTNFNILHPDSYIRYTDGVTTARLSYVREVIDNSTNNLNRSITYNGTDFDPTEPVADPSTDVFPAFKSATSELHSTKEPIMVFAGTSGDFGSNLYFDKQSAVLSTTEFDLSSVLVYPNPVTNLLVISSPQKTIDQLMVYNYLGQLVIKSEPNAIETQIDMNGLNKGLYLVHISVEGKPETHKVIKK